MEVHLHALIIPQFRSMGANEIERKNARAKCARQLVLFNHLIRFAIDTLLIAVKFSLDSARKSERVNRRRKCLHFDYTNCVFFTLSISRVNLLDLCALFTFCLSMVCAYCRRKSKSSHLKPLLVPALVRGKYSLLGSS